MITGAEFATLYLMLHANSARQLLKKPREFGPIFWAWLALALVLGAAIGYWLTPSIS
jgi:hypothetical protein